MLSFKKSLKMRACAHQTRTNVGDVNAILEKLCTQSFREPDERELARGVGQQVRYSNFAADRRDIHDPPLPARLHVRCYGIDQLQRSPKMNSHGMQIGRASCRE